MVHHCTPHSMNFSSSLLLSSSKHYYINPSLPIKLYYLLTFLIISITLMRVIQNFNIQNSTKPSFFMNIIKQISIKFNPLTCIY